ncbi:MAG: AMP-binding protein [Magnetococcales bacterium]|nr:AMP-binding protein [Magnetococcales bacterium]
MRSLILSSFERHDNLIALAGSWGKITYTDLSHLVSGVISLATHNKVSRNDYVIYFGADSSVMYATLLASCLGNFRMMVLGEQTSIEAVKRHINTLDAKLVISTANIKFKIETSSVDQVIPIQKEPSAFHSAVSHMTLTSGSLGAPKIIGVDSLGLAEFLKWARYNLALRPEHIWIECGDYTSDMWMNNALMALTSGSSIYYDPQKNPLSAYAQLAKSQATHFRSVPQISKLISAGRRRSLQRELSLEFVGLGGDIVHHSTLVEMNAWLPRKTKLYTTYGCAEVAGFSMIKHINREKLSLQNDRAIPDLGSPTVNTSIKILPRNGSSSGELQISSKQVCIEWLDTKNGSSNFYQLKAPGEVGIYNTSDIVDDSGDGLVYQGRLGREIVRNGNRVQLETMEELLIKRLGATCVVLKSGDDLTLLVEASPAVSVDQINLIVAEEVPSFVCPTNIMTAKVLPRNLRGKINYAACEKLIHDSSSLEND